MQKKSFFKDLMRSITKTKARFFSIMAIIALGVGFFAGIHATAPDMLISADTYFKDYNLSNFRVMNPLGFKESDVEEIKNIHEVSDILESYIKDAFLIYGENQTGIIKIYGFDDKEYEAGSLINTPLVTKGRLPEKTGEIVLEDDLRTVEHIQVGDKVNISLPEGQDTSEYFSKTEFEVVGFIISPLYITFERGQTNIGDGSVDYYGYINDNDFNADRVTDIFIKTKKSNSLIAFSDEYEGYHESPKEKLTEIGIDSMAKETKKLRDELSESKDELLDKKAEAEKEIEEGEKKLLDAGVDLDRGKKELDENEVKYTKEFQDKRKDIEYGKDELQKGKDEYYRNYTVWLEGYNEYQDGHEKLSASKSTLDNAKNQIIQGEKELESAKDQLDNAKGQLAVLEETLAGLKGISDNLPEVPSITEEDYNRFIEDIRVYAPDIAEFIENNISYNDGNALKEIKEALSSGIVRLEDTLRSSKVQYDQGIKDYESGIKEIEENKKKYESGLKEYNEGLAKLEESKAELDRGKAQLDQADKLLQEKEKEILEGEKTLNKAEKEFKSSLEKGRQKIEDGRIELEEAWMEFDLEKNDALDKIDDAEKEIKDAERMLLELPEEWFVYTREGNPGYAGLGDDVDRLKNLAMVFPLFFFLVAALVCLTTMTRMVEEERVQIGTFKALGYSTLTISTKYLTYSLLASLIGSILGFIVGFQLFPRVIITVYGAMYSTPYIMSPFHGDLAIVSTAIAVVTTVTASLFATINELRETPAVLMQPKAPKPGKRIFLERIKPLWSRLSFSYKVTFRNIFRYKRRFFMTVIGIAGCTALLVTGFGLKDSVNAIMDKQFDEIFIYDGMIVIDTEKDEGQRDLDKILGQDSDIESYIGAYNEAVSVYKKGSTRDYEVNLIVPLEADRFDEFFNLHQRKSDEKIPLNKEGAIVTEKLAETLNIHIGDTLMYKDTENRTYEFKISGIAENYLSHYIFMDTDYFDSVTLREAPENAGIFTLKDPDTTDSSVLKERLMESEGVLGTMIVDTLREEFEKRIVSLDYVVYILIISAGTLAFVVLYNLTNINITERVREIATIKVLGFRDGEVSAYVYRENIFLTIIGTFVGLVLGYVLHSYVITTMEIDSMMFGRNIKVLSYLYSMVTTMLFSAIVNFFMYYKLREVNMVESLKSIE